MTGLVKKIRKGTDATDNVLQAVAEEGLEKFKHQGTESSPTSKCLHSLHTLFLPNLAASAPKPPQAVTASVIAQSQLGQSPVADAISWPGPNFHDHSPVEHSLEVTLEAAAVDFRAERLKILDGQLAVPADMPQNLGLPHVEAGLLHHSTSRRITRSLRSRTSALWVSGPVTKSSQAVMSIPLSRTLWIDR